jgi:hypothetical protein
MRCPIAEHTVRLHHNSNRIAVNAVSVCAMPVLCNRIANETNNSNRFAMKAMPAHVMTVLCNRSVNETTLCKASVSLAMWPHHKDNCDRIGALLNIVACGCQTLHKQSPQSMVDPEPVLR